MPRKKEDEKIKLADAFSIAGKIFSSLFSFLLFLLILFSFTGLFSSEESSIPKGNIAVVPINGIITTSISTGILGEKTTDSSKILKLLKKINESEDFKALLLEINSPGGSPVASEEISDFVKKINKTKVAVIRESGASGAYWIATSADRIFASRMSVTGSIGVTASSLEFAGLLNDYNVTYRRLVAGKYKDAGSPYKQLTSEERKLYQDILDAIHENFIKTVAENRNLSEEKVKELATGFVFLGEEAKKLGLIDEIGNKNDAVSYIERKLNITAKLAEVKSKKSIFDAFSESFEELFYALGHGIGKAFTAEQRVEILT